MAIEYKDFMKQQVGVVTIGRVANSESGSAGSSLLLEGILAEETPTQIYLEEMKVPQLSDGQLEINSSYAAISKDKIITVYLASDEFEE